MSAEEKKTQPNSLATSLSHLRGRVSGRRMYTLGGLAALVIAGIVIFVILRRNSRDSESQRWVDLATANTEEKTKEILKSEKHQGKETKGFAKLFLARVYTYERGLNALGTLSSSEQAKAIKNIEDGRKMYLDALNDLKDSPMLQQEAWVSAALAEQVLAGVPKEDNPLEYRGSITNAIDYYKKAAGIKSDSEPSKNYAKKAEDMEAEKETIAKFYQELYRRGQMPKLPPSSFDGFGGP